jgi:hypothetical protein
MQLLYFVILLKTKWLVVSNSYDWFFSSILICANLQFIVFSLCRGEKTTRQQNHNYHLFALKRWQNVKTTKWKVDKTTKLGRKDDKHSPLISDLICRLLLDFLSFCHLFASKRRQDDKTIDVVFSGNKTKSRQDGKTPSESRQLIHYTTRKLPT